MSVDDLLVRLRKLQQTEAGWRKAAAVLEGRRAQLMEQLQEEFGVSTYEDGQKKLESMTKNLEKRKVRAEKLLSELEERVQGHE